jgi:hypothetical protein
LKHAIEIQKAIINQLTGAGFQLETLSTVQIRELSFRWTERFIGKKTAPGIASYKWHIFSYGLTQSFTGDEATNLYQKQHPVDTYIFNENLSFGLICYKNTFLPKVQLKIYQTYTSAITT